MASPPMSSLEFRFTSANRLPIARARWDGRQPVCGVVQIAYGMGEHNRRYLGLIGALVSAGFTVHGNDHRRHGRTPRSSAHDLRETKRIPERAEVAQLIPSANDHTKAVLEAASDPNNRSELCRATVKMLVSILASEAGHLAPKVLATGEVYLGEVALRILSVLNEPQLIQPFAKKGRFKDRMGRIPVHVITARAALVGAASFRRESRDISGVAA